MIEVVAFAGTLADAGEHRQTAVLLGDVVDELQHVDGLADAGTAEQADLAALGERHQQVDDLDAGHQQVLAARLLVVGRRRTVNRQVLLVLTGPFSSCGLPSTSMMRPRVPAPTGTEIALAGARHVEPAAQAFGRAHRDGAHDAVAQLLLHLEGQVHIIELERVIDLGDLIAREFHVDDRADDLYDFSAGHN